VRLFSSYDSFGFDSCLGTALQRLDDRGDEGYRRCSVCGNDLVNRKLAEDSAENADGDGGAADYLLPQEGVNYVHAELNRPLLSHFDLLPLRVEQRIREQRGNSFNPLPKPFCSFTGSTLS
jgi:hypothetical protein